MFNSMTPPQVNSYGEPCCLRPLPSQGVPSMGTTEGECVYQSLGLEDLAGLSPTPGIPPTHPYPTLVSYLQEDLRPHVMCALSLGSYLSRGLEVSPVSPHPNAPVQLSLFSRIFWFALLPPSQLYVRAPGLWVCQRDQRLYRG